MEKTITSSIHYPLLYDLVFQFQEVHSCIIGRSSVGKSSRFNYLHNDENYSVVAKETNITRDRIEVRIARDGYFIFQGISELFKIPVRLVDTAGIENVNLKKL